MKKLKRFYFICGILMLLSELWKQWCLTYIVNSSTYDWWYFPFQLCSIPMYVCLVLPLINHLPSIRMLLSFLMTFTLLSGFFTFFDTSGLSYPYAPLTIHSFLWHILLVIIGLLSGIFGRKFCSFTDFFRSTLFFLATCAIATLINVVVHPYGKIDMFYISPYYKMPQIVFCDISDAVGNVPAICIYILCIITGALIIHLLWKKLPSITMYG